MTLVDWLIVAFTVLLAMYGYAQGFIVGALSLVGFGLGAFLGTRLAPLILPEGSHSQYAALFGLLGALLAGVWEETAAMLTFLPKRSVRVARPRLPAERATWVGAHSRGARARRTRRPR